MSILHRDGSSHGVFVPFISAILLWKRKDRIKALEPKLSLLPGVMVVGVSFLMLYLTKSNTENTLPALSFFLMVLGLVIAIIGIKIFKEVSFPLFFLMTMIPLPQPVYDQIAEWMRTTSTVGSTCILQLFGIPFERDGFHIHLPDINLYVAHGCSGIRYLICYFVFGLAYAFVYKQSIKSRIVVIIATIPISVIAGIIRLTTIFLSVNYIGTFMADHLYHVILSWFVFAFIMILVILMDMKWLRPLCHWTNTDQSPRTPL
ncbi:MAG: exosortase/archaeosortase family protein [Planctomycetes bacterium]|nr:exosortase/archaeosortase family protein [Planctomycetota bacterium]